MIAVVAAGLLVTALQLLGAGRRAYELDRAVRLVAWQGGADEGGADA
jgi:hypothetical protein